MKRHHNIFSKNVLLLLLALIGLGACSEFLDINDDPDNPTEVSSQFLLPTAQVNLTFRTANVTHRITSALIQHYAGTGNQLARFDDYVIFGSDIDNPWNGFYAGALQDLRLVEEQSLENGQNAFAGISIVLQAYAFSLLTDQLGDIPFSETLQGQQVLSPQFEAQEDIYPQLFARLDEGIALLQGDPGGLTPNASTDFIYAGNLDQWVRFANSLQLKLSVQMRLVEPALAEQNINSLLQGNQMLRDNGDNFSLAFTNAAGNQHPMFDFAFNNREGDIAISQRFIDSLEILNDPRIGLYLTNNGQVDGNGDPVFNGFDNGSLGAPPTMATRARLGVFPVGAGGEAPQRMLTFYQQQFTLAEAALTLNISSSNMARDYFESALTAAFDEVGIDGSTYIANRLAAYDNASDDDARLNIVMRDKWVALFGNGVDAWTDWRRTGFPQLLPSTTANSPDNQIPRTLPYSQNELGANPNAPGQQRLINERVWWDIRP